MSTTRDSHCSLQDLQGILNRSVNAEALKEIMRNFKFEKTIMTSIQCDLADQAGFRVERINNIYYILCPVPFLHDPTRKLEAGFAIEVTKKAFAVYPFMHDQASDEYLLLEHLPHCVHRAITVDIDSFRTIDDEVLSMSSEASAIFFISNLINDLAVGMDTPVLFFDNKLYFQLVNRINKANQHMGYIASQKWINTPLIDLQFRHIMAQCHDLDPASPVFELNRKRILVNLTWFLFGFEDDVMNRGFFDHVPLESFFTFSDTIASLIAHNQVSPVSRYFDEYMSEVESWRLLRKLKGMSKEMAMVLFDSFSKRGMVQVIDAIIIATGFFPEKRGMIESWFIKVSSDATMFSKELEKRIRKVYSITGVTIDERTYRKIVENALVDCRVEFLEGFLAFFDEKPMVDPLMIQDAYKILALTCNLKDARKLQDLTGVRPQVSNTLVHLLVLGLAYFRGIHQEERDNLLVDYEKKKDIFVLYPLDPLRSQLARELSDVLDGAGLNIAWNHDAVTKLLSSLLYHHEFEAMALLSTITGIPIELDCIQDMFKSLIDRALVSEAMRLELVVGQGPDRSIVVARYYELLEKGQALSLIELHDWTMIPVQAPVEKIDQYISFAESKCGPEHIKRLEKLLRRYTNTSDLIHFNHRA